MPDAGLPAQAVLWAMIADASLAFEAAGIASPRFDAEELAAYAFGVPRSRLRSVAVLEDSAVGRFRSGVLRRASREPLQHIVGTAAFRHVEVAVGPGVFVPRPETEVVAGWAIERAREVGPAQAVVVDLCTGSGAIALAVADEVPTAVVHAVELSEPALHWARRNTVSSRVVLHAGDARTALPELDQAVDVVVSNPPYIPADGQVRDAEVLQHDPPIALWGLGPDGLEVLRGVASRALALLRPGGWFVVEHADVQGAAVLDLLRQQGGWSQVSDHQDLTGRDRFATARKADVTAGDTGRRAGLGRRGEAGR
jgi:release factor glutamine methyltransferase